MPEDQRTVAQHTVPNFYLKRFADADGILKCTDRESGRSFPITTKKATVINDFYSIETDAGLSDSIERQIGVLESKAKPLIARLATEGPVFNDFDRTVIAEFFTFLWLRTSAKREEQEWMINDFAKQFLALRAAFDLRAAEESGDLEQLAVASIVSRFTKSKTFTENDEHIVVVDRNAHVENLLDLLRDILPFFISRTWQVVNFPRGGLITSDDPVTLWSPAKEGRPRPSAGTAHQIWVPLDRNNLLVMCLPSVATQGEIRRELDDPGLLRRVNERTAFNSHRWIYQHPEDEGLGP